MEDFKTQSEINDWLKNQSSEVVWVYSARAALRLLPVYISEITPIDEKPNDTLRLDGLFLPTLRALALNLDYGLWPTFQLMKSVLAAKDIIAKIKGGGVISCSYSVFCNLDCLTNNKSIKFDFEFLTVKENNTTQKNNDDFLTATSYDSRFIENGGSSNELAQLPLWPAGEMPEEFKGQSLWRNLKSTLLRRNESWEVWTSWYEDRLEGRPLVKAIETGDFVSKQFGRVTFPDEDYKSAITLNPKIKKIIDDYKAQFSDASASIEQIPGAFAFSTRKGKIQARSLKYSPENSELAQAAMEELAFIAENSIKTLTLNHADSLLTSLVERFLESLPEKVTDLKSGLLMMQVTSLDGFIEAFSHPDNEQEKNLLGALLALKKSADAFQGMFPELQKVQANQLALQLQNADVAEINKNLDEVSVFAKQSDFVGVSAINALESGSDELDILNKKIDITFNLEQRATLIETQAQVTAHRVVNNRNFFAKALDEVKDVTGSAYGAAKKGLNKGVEGAVSGGVKGGIAILIGSLVGPLAGLAVLVGSFAPIAKKSEEIENSLGKNSFEV